MLIIRNLFLLIYFLLLSTAYAQDEAERPEIENTPAEQAQDNRMTTSSSDASDESFIPSEIISEDLSVPFPVDI